MINNYVPTLKFKNNKKKFVDPTISKLITKQFKLWMKYKKTKSQKIFIRYLYIKNKIRKLLYKYHFNSIKKFLKKNKFFMII